MPPVVTSAFDFAMLSRATVLPPTTVLPSECKERAATEAGPLAPLETAVHAVVATELVA